jgi:hypothetical protein
MNKRTYLLSVLALLVSLYSSGQNPYFGIKGGMNLSHMTLKNSDGKLIKGFNLSPGFNIGATMDYRVRPALTINASLLVSSKGYQQHTKEDFQGVEIKSTEKLMLFYVDVPIHIRYEFELGFGDFFAGGGPYIAYGYWGKYRWYRTGGGETEWDKADVYWGTNPDTDDFINLDYGASLSVGGKLDNIVLEIGYNLGLKNISSNTDNGQIARNGVVFVSVSYFFSRFYKYNEGTS